MNSGSPFQVMDETCCAPDSATLHEDLTELLSKYDVNAAAASVKVYAIKPKSSSPESTNPKSCCGPTCCS
jgi:hypothetical protein